MNTKLFREMSPDEQSAFIQSFSDYVATKLPLVQQKAGNWVSLMQEGLRLITVIPQSHSFVEQALRYGDYGCRVNRLGVYIKLIQEQIDQGELAPRTPLVSSPSPKRGRPASAATIAKREAEAEAARLQQQLFTSEPAAAAPQVSGAFTMQPQVMAAMPSTTDYKLTMAQIRPFLSPELQAQTAQIRDLRIAAGAASEKAKTMAELKTKPDAIAPVAQEAQRLIEQIDAIYAEVDSELAVIWYRLQNDEPFRGEWLKRYGYKSADDLHADLKNDLRKHYQKMKSPEFDLRCRTIIEQNSPEYVAQQKAEAAKKKEVQDIIRYLKRKDKPATDARVKTAREKFKRLEQLLGKKEAADYKPFLNKIVEDSKKDPLGPPA